MNEYDVAVVGAGPAGSSVAQRLAANGTNVAIIEEHATIGEPLHCAGLITQRVIDLAACDTHDIVQNIIYGACIHPPSEATLTIGGEKKHAAVINRQRFDETLARNAQNAGADLLMHHKVILAHIQKNHAMLSVRHNEKTIPVQCKILIGADGPHSTIRKTLGFPQSAEMLNGIGAELTDLEIEPRFVHVFVGNKIAPGFFAWVIPTNNKGTAARIGLAISSRNKKPIQHYLAELLKQPLLQHATITKRFGGVLPLGPLKQTTADHVLLVGDAAAQVKPTSGGGLYPGLLCANHCARITHEALQTHHYTNRSLKKYHTAWSKDIGKELSLGLRFRRMFSRLSDKQLDKYIEKLNNQKTIELINAYGDIDYPSKLAIPLVKKNPSLLSLAPSMLKRTKP
jgi:geranylgeranyl reductase family protein